MHVIGSTWVDRPVAHAWIVAYLVVLFALPAPWSTVIIDTARDFVEAERWLQQGMPLRGPMIGNLFHLGPWWYLLTAGGFALTGSIAATLTLEALLAAMKFPLAYVCGCVIYSSRLGVCWAIALAVPGMASMTQLVITHTAIIEFAILGWILTALLLCKGHRGAWWLAFGAMASLSAHAHPTTLVFAPAACFIVALRRKRTDLPWIIAGVLVFVLTFAPVLIAESREHWPSLQALSSHGQSIHWAGSLGRIAAVYLGALAAGPQFVSLSLLAGWSGLIGLTYLALACTVLVGAGWAWRNQSLRPVLIVAAATCMVFVLLIATLRQITPYYMLLASKPFGTLAMAVAFVALVERAHRSRMLATLVLLAILLLHGLVSMSWIYQAESGSARLPVATISDMAQSPQRLEAVSMMPVWRLESLAARSCGRKIVLHASMAQLVMLAAELPMQTECEARPEVIYGGAAQDAEHLLGLTPYELRLIGYSEANWQQALELAPISTQGSSWRLSWSRHYPYIMIPREGQREFHYEQVTSANNLLVVSTPFGIVDGSEVDSVEVDQGVATLVSKTRASSIYRCRGCAGKARWTVRARAADPRQIDIVEIRPGPNLLIQ
ncbi:hypothetical protein [Pseudomarimonas arenosa]|uniref:Glycosyltransferase RgtA/B/C/D-like domain-containing protein n=1 Tax=Pseudomarimonas arenosa TaxID=2774145 RepID=A0AAW3ZN28_9GAMM|nr:hypothetical protein [Pseudomarimonas arenosa]MBD8527553.1 hypothetical protein [Pseudomarimonas arenosa]